MLKRKSVGFSLIELLVVLVIMGLLAGLVGPRLFSKVDTSKVKTAQTQIKMLKTALYTYRLDVGAFPSTEQGVNALTTPISGAAAQRWDGPYLDEAVPLDPWGNAYQYRLEASSNEEFVLFSMGADGALNGEGINADVGYLPR